MLTPDGTSATHVEHGQGVRNARVAARERALDLVAMEVLLDERLVGLLQGEPLDFTVRAVNCNITEKRRVS